MFTKQKDILKRGAMFGLDARVALAIMGTLTIIAGVNVIGATQNAKMSKAVFEGKEIITAIKQYEFDVQDKMAIHSNNAVLLIKELTISAKTGWEGPYTSADLPIGINQDIYLRSPMLGRFSVLKTKDRGATSTSQTPYNACVSTEPCYLWILYDDPTEILKNKASFAKLDQQLDSGDGFLTGRVQKFNNALLVRWDRIDI